VLNSGKSVLESIVLVGCVRSVVVGISRSAVLESTVTVWRTEARSDAEDRTAVGVSTMISEAPAVRLVIMESANGTTSLDAVVAETTLSSATRSVVTAEPGTSGVS